MSLLDMPFKVDKLLEKVNGLEKTMASYVGELDRANFLNRLNEGEKEIILAQEKIFSKFPPQFHTYNISEKIVKYNEGKSNRSIKHTPIPGVLALKDLLFCKGFKGDHFLGSYNTGDILAFHYDGRLKFIWDGFDILNRYSKYAEGGRGYWDQRAIPEEIYESIRGVEFTKREVDFYKSFYNSYGVQEDRIPETNPFWLCLARGDTKLLEGVYKHVIQSIKDGLREGRFKQSEIEDSAIVERVISKNKYCNSFDQSNFPGKIIVRPLSIDAWRRWSLHLRCDDNLGRSHMDLIPSSDLEKYKRNVIKQTNFTEI